MKGKEDINRLVAFDFAGTGVRAIAAEVREDNAIKIVSEEIRKVDEIKNGIITSFRNGFQRGRVTEGVTKQCRPA